MDTPIVHPRVLERHSEFAEQDITHAWNNCISFRRREDIESDEYIAVGSDQNGRLLELVAECKSDDWLIYHAMTPPSKKTLKELGLTGGKHEQERN